MSRPVAIGQARGRAHALDDGAQGLVTWHPSYLLRLPDPKAKERIEAEFVADLASAWRLAAA